MTESLPMLWRLPHVAADHLITGLGSGLQIFIYLLMKAPVEHAQRNLFLEFQRYRIAVKQYYQTRLDDLID
jgi:hypothetical protein